MNVYWDLKKESQMNDLSLYHRSHNFQMIMVHFQECMLVMLDDKHVDYNRLDVTMNTNDRSYYSSRYFRWMLTNEMDQNLIHSMTKLKYKKNQERI